MWWNNYHSAADFVLLKLQFPAQLSTAGDVVLLCAIASGGLDEEAEVSTPGTNRSERRHLTGDHDRGEIHAPGRPNRNAR